MIQSSQYTSEELELIKRQMEEICLHIISKQISKDWGISNYFTGEPCKYGHYALRPVSTGVCRTCAKIKSINARVAGVYKEYHARTREEKNEKSRLRHKKFREMHPERAKENDKKSYANCDKERRYLTAKMWRQANKGKVNSVTANRRAFKKKATPCWLSSHHKRQIRVLYTKARELTDLFGGKFEVDHVVPLDSEIVCGLHVPWNLQLLDKPLNRKKSNLIWPDMPE